MTLNADVGVSFKLTRLRLMMFFEYAVRGVWLPLASVFLSAKPADGGLGFTDTQVGYTVGLALAVGAILSPFIAGPLADRWFSTQKLMGLLLLLGGAVKLVTAYQTSYSAWLWLSILYAILFMPTMSLSNSLAMGHLEDPKRQFPGVRVWGTIAWIAVSWLFPMIWLKSNLEFQWLPPFFAGDDIEPAAGRMLDSVKVAGVLAIVYGVYCWTCLPDTPPRRDAKSLALTAAFRLYNKKSLMVLLVATLLVGTSHFLYFFQTGKFLKAIGLEKAYIMPAMSIGQFAEIGTMAALGLMMRRLGFRTVITLGALCYVARYLIFGMHESLSLPVIVASQALHGPCFACFYAAGFIYVDRMAPADVKHSAQTVFGLMCFGIGPLTAGQLNGMLARWSTPAGGVLDYQKFWFVAAGVAFTGLLTLLIGFRDQTDQSR
jgi:nucleoside transporter